ncbi:LysE family translocator [Saccharopolyspora flava]|uniref:Threonine/homoserine/homoserine lactone efflux protein n=1 Tax=Saccharopolyspora flava TaxID=95161 RepID=A0A1I6TU49_9PSEU|nr:LysE family translocator [Saccharopolyspora flava]SFS92690.1 Threonine/homoserine/homoserine lactone efflux protein [Saccharopolyspora flava]
MSGQLVAFVGACLAVIVVPGPDLALLLRNAAVAGRPGAAATAGGIMTGNTVLATAAVAGLTALLQASGPLYNAIRLAGAAYLIYLGVRALISLIRRDEEPRSEDAVPRPGLTTRQAFRQGLLSNLLNPKVAAFYLALFPQFTLPGMPTLVQHTLLAGLFCALSLAWYVLLIAVLGRVQVWLRRREVQRTITGASAAALITLGAGLAVQN